MLSTPISGLQPSISSPSLAAQANKLLKNISHSSHEIQTTIHDELNFKRNSVNLLIGRRGSGKTYNVFREIIKLNFVPNHEYTQLIYITNKLSDDTFHKMKKLIKLEIIKVNYEDAEECLTKITEAKEDYGEIVEKGIENLLEEDYRKDLMGILGVKDFKKTFIHTIVLFDDAIEVFKNRKGKLFRMLFENRQPKITYFLAIQDPIGIDASIKSNIDSAWLFGGFSSQKFNYIYHQLNSPFDRVDLWEKYRELSMNQAIIFNHNRTGTELRFLRD